MKKFDLQLFALGTKNISFDLDMLEKNPTVNGTNFIPAIVAGETGAKFIITVSVQGTAIDITDATTIDLNIIQPDETTDTVTGASVTPASGICSFEFAGTEIADAGTYYGEVELADATDTIKSRQFKFIVEDSVD